MAFSIFPRMIYKTRSKINGEIVVKEQFGQYTLQVQGLIQSGGIVKNVWQKPLSKIRNSVRQPADEIQKVLILGLGGGTVVQLIKVHWPKAEIVGVEIDSEIIKIGKKYFSLGKANNLKIVEDNAFNFVAKTKAKFDLIIIDMYLGKNYPAQAEKDEFLENVKNILSQKGVAIFNRLDINFLSANLFESNLRKYFSDINRVKTRTNLFFLARD